MQDQFDVTLEDGELLLEVEITANLIVAASESDGPLSQAEIDAILGVTPAGEGGATTAADGSEAPTGDDSEQATPSTDGPASSEA